MKDCRRGVWRETIERTVGDACPYSGFVRKVIAVVYGGIMPSPSSSLRAPPPLPWGEAYMVKPNAFRTVYVSKPNVVFSFIFVAEQQK